MADKEFIKCDPRTAEYRRCASCMCQFAPITSNADDRYKFCSSSCEDPTDDDTEQYAHSAYTNGY